MNAAATPLPALGLLGMAAVWGWGLGFYLPGVRSPRGALSLILATVACAALTRPAGLGRTAPLHFGIIVVTVLLVRLGVAQLLRARSARTLNKEDPHGR